MRRWLIILPLVLSACKPEPKVSTYEVKSESVQTPAKEIEDTSSKNTAMKGNATMQAEVASFAEPQWGTIPANWTASAPNPMRKGSWSISHTNGTKAEMTVTVFPGDVGGDTANVNRWRGQLGLEKATDDKIKSDQTPVTVGNLPGRLYSISSSDGKKSTTAIILPKDKATWFFKLSGDTDCLNAEKESFLKMVTQTQLP